MREHYLVNCTHMRPALYEDGALKS